MKKRISILIALCVIVLLVLVSCGSLSSGSSVSTASDIIQPTRWEYTVVVLGLENIMNYDLIQEQLNQKGLEGWEFVQNDNYGMALYFKRPLP